MGAEFDQGLVELLFAGVTEGRVSNVMCQAGNLAGGDVEAAEFTELLAKGWVPDRLTPQIVCDLPCHEGHFLTVRQPVVQNWQQEVGG